MEEDHLLALQIQALLLLAAITIIASPQALALRHRRLAVAALRDVARLWGMAPRLATVVPLVPPSATEHQQALPKAEAPVLAIWEAAVPAQTRALAMELPHRETEDATPAMAIMETTMAIRAQV